MSCTGLGRLKAECVEGSCTACCWWLAGELVRTLRLLEWLEEGLKEEVEELEVLKVEGGSLTTWRLEAGSPLVLTPSCRGGEAAAWAGGRLDCGLAPGDTNPLEPRLPLLVLVLDTEPCLHRDTGIDIIDSVDIVVRVDSVV